jgi:hypothetical protein
MEDYLYQKDLWWLLGGKAKKPLAMFDEDWDILDRKALGSIRLCLAPSVAFNILMEKTKKDLMSTLIKLYEKPSASNKVFLKDGKHKKDEKLELVHTDVWGPA